MRSASATTPLGQLTEAWTPGTTPCTDTPTVAALGGPAPYWHTWTYDDATANRVNQRVRASGTDSTSTYKVRIPNGATARPHITSGGVDPASFTYNADGSTATSTRAGVITNYGWDLEGRLANTSSSAGATSNVYDADGNLLIAQNPTGATLYAGVSTDIVYTKSTATKKVINRYQHAGTTTATSENTGAPTYAIANNQNTVTRTVNYDNTVGAVRRFDPYGNPRAAVSRGTAAARSSTHPPTPPLG